MTMISLQDHLTEISAVAREGKGKDAEKRLDTILYLSTGGQEGTDHGYRSSVKATNPAPPVEMVVLEQDEEEEFKK